MKGKHLCKSMRGIRNDGDMTVAHFTGVFETDPEKRAQFYNMIMC